MVELAWERFIELGKRDKCWLLSFQLFPQWVLILSQTKISDSSKLKEFADDNFKFEEKWQKILQMGTKNTVGKGEIACYEQFLFFPQCFQKTCTADM